MVPSMSNSMPFTLSKGGSWVTGAAELMVLDPVTAGRFQWVPPRPAKHSCSSRSFRCCAYSVGCVCQHRPGDETEELAEQTLENGKPETLGNTIKGQAITQELTRIEKAWGASIERCMADGSFGEGQIPQDYLPEVLWLVRLAPKSHKHLA